MSPQSRSAVPFVLGAAAILVLEIAAVVVFYLVAVRPRGREAGVNGPLRVPDLPASTVADYAMLLRDRNGATVDMASLKGKVIVLNVWATWCGPCVRELPTLARLREQFSGDDRVRVICVTEEPPEVMRAAKWLTPGMPLFSLAGGSLPRTYRTRGIPATFIIDRAGRIAYAHVGMAKWDDSRVVDFIHALL